MAIQHNYTTATWIVIDLQGIIPNFCINQLFVVPLAVSWCILQYITLPTDVFISACVWVLAMFFIPCFCVSAIFKQQGNESALNFSLNSTKLLTATHQIAKEGFWQSEQALSYARTFELLRETNDEYFRTFRN